MNEDPRRDGEPQPRREAPIPEVLDADDRETYGGGYNRGRFTSDFFGPREFGGGRVRVYGCSPGCLLMSLLVSVTLSIILTLLLNAVF